MNVTEYRNYRAISYSTAKYLLTSPAHYMAARNTPREASPAMHFGSVAHARILENKDIVADEYAVKPDGMNFATTAGKEWKAAQTKPIISASDVADVISLADSVEANPHAMALLKGCEHREMPLTGTMFGVECKALLDVCGSDGEQWVIADLKTCHDASPRAFARTVADYHYDLQAAWYSTLLASVHGLEVAPFWSWIAVEKKAPFTSVVYTAEDWMESGMAKLEKVLTLYKECKASGEWPQPYRGMHKLERPKWA